MSRQLSRRKAGIAAGIEQDRDSRPDELSYELSYELPEHSSEACTEHSIALPITLQDRHLRNSREAKRWTADLESGQVFEELF